MVNFGMGKLKKHILVWHCSPNDQKLRFCSLNKVLKNCCILKNQTFYNTWLRNKLNNNSQGSSAKERADLNESINIDSISA
jgi:hypothetical protein